MLTAVECTAGPLREMAQTSKFGFLQYIHLMIFVYKEGEIWNSDYIQGRADELGAVGIVLSDDVTQGHMSVGPQLTFWPHLLLVMWP